MMEQDPISCLGVNCNILNPILQLDCFASTGLTADVQMQLFSKVLQQLRILKK